jgi:hypothetical protein
VRAPTRQVIWIRAAKYMQKDSVNQGFWRGKL